MPAHFIIPSVHLIARENGLCSEELYQFNLELLIEETTLSVIFLEMKVLLSILPIKLPHVVTDDILKFKI